MAWTLCSRKDVTDIHPTNAAALQDFWSDTVESMIREWLGMPDLGKTATYTDDKYDGLGTPYLQLRGVPVQSVQAVRVEGMSLVASDYVLQGNTLVLLYGSFPAGRSNVSVDYTAGSAVDGVTGLAIVDPKIRFTAAAMIVAILNYRSRAGSDVTLRWGGAEQKEGEASPNVNIGLTSHLNTIMRRMLRKTRLRIR